MRQDNQNYDTITQEFLAAAKRDQLPENLATAVTELHVGPLSGTDALVTWERWIQAAPDDPIGDLTIRDIRDLFQKSVNDLERSQNALDELSSLVTDPAHLSTFAERSREANWAAFRSAIANGLPKETTSPQALLSTLDTPLRLAQQGLLQELLVESLRRSNEAFAEQSTLLDELAKRGVAGLSQVLGPAARLKGYGRAILWHVGGTALAGGVAVAGGLLGSTFVAGGCGLAAAGYCGYCLGKYARVW